MASFRYRALTARGEIVTGELTAPHRAEVLKRIEYLGLIPVETEEVVAQGSGFAALFSRNFTLRDLGSRGPTADDVTTFSRDLALLLRAEIRVDQALGLLCEPEMSGALAPTVAGLHGAVKAGENFADALGRTPALFPPLYCALVRIGEASGHLADVMEAVAEQRLRMAELRRKALDALRYPAFLLLTATLVLVFFLVYVLPKFASVFQDLGAQADPIVRMLLVLSQAVQDNGGPILGALCVMAFGIRQALHAPGIRARVLRMFLTLPFLRDLSTDYRTALFCRMLGTLLGNGAQLPTALHLVADVIADSVSAEIWLRTRERVRQGARLGDALAAHNELSAVAVRMLKIGEEAGHLPAITLRAADLVEVRLERRLQRLTAIVGPAAILTIAVIVGGLVVSLMTSLLSIGQLAN